MMSSTDGIGKSARDLDGGGKIKRGAARNGRLLRGRGKERCKGRWMNEYSWKSVVLRTPESNDVDCVGLSVLAPARLDSIETLHVSVGRMRDNPLPSGSWSEFVRIYTSETALDVGSLSHYPVICSMIPVAPVESFASI